ncbi:MAG: TetR/AcrR family transcriptional regulator [Hydrocarboniphaga sp.]|uniref:TetR/AcrR family transcriptional regulator n=1 Tax=Hydrocarboniphaga sp. TaxID=2033016 RepID=UPI00261D6172|nr:TetR/AcrR family transcriptional regulator [Hydrocarboniphaga sp.]MDB5970629.1 TetR/AcrR family transcriptional regulator [Hydrocarboniphaga sp.]
MSNKKPETLQRVLEIASLLFVEHPFPEVSVITIAKLAHCSTATIYDCFGGKEQLFAAAVRHRLKECLPYLDTLHDRQGLDALLEFTKARIEALSRPTTRAILNAISKQSEILQPALAQQMQELQRETDDTAYLCIRGALDEGSLRPLPVETLRYSIFAVSAYGPTLLSLYGTQYPMSMPDAIERTFNAIVSESGKAILERYLRERFPGERS